MTPLDSATQTSGKSLVEAVESDFNKQFSEDINAQRKSLLGRIGSGTVKAVKDTAVGLAAGTGNVAAETIDFATDLGVLAAKVVVDTSAMPKDRKEMYGESLEDFQKIKDRVVEGATSFIRTENKEGEPWFNFVKNTTESAWRVAYFWKQIGKTGAGTATKVIGSGAGEGLVQDPDKEIAATKTMMRSVLGGLSPEAQADFDALMDPETDDYIARQAMRRVMSAVDMGAVGGAFLGAGKVVGKAVGGAMDQIPPEYINKMTELYGDTLKTMRVGIEKLRDNTGVQAGKSKVVQPVYEAGVAGTRFSVATDAAYDPTKTARENLRTLLEVKYDSTGRIRSPQDLNLKLADYEKKLGDLAPEIEAKVVSMAQSRGVSEREALATFAKELGIEEADDLAARGLRDVLRQQAHNILAEQEAAKFVLSAKNFANKAISEDDYIESYTSFLTVQRQRAELLTGAGRTMRTSQEINPNLKMILDQVKIQEAQIGDILSKYEVAITDKAAARIMADNLAQTLQVQRAMAMPDDAVTVALLLAGKSGEQLSVASARMPMIMQGLKNSTDFMGRLTQANLLSALPTMSQNTLGTMVFQADLIVEKYLQAGLGVTGRTSGGATFAEANALLTGVMSGYMNATRALLNTTTHAAFNRGKPGAEKIPLVGQFRQDMADIPTMTPESLQTLMHSEKQEVGSNLSASILGQQVSTAKKILTGEPVFNIIAMQDAAAKHAWAHGAMQGKFKLALADDVFGVKSLGTDLKKANRVMSDMFMEGRDTLTMDDLRALGVSGEDGAKISLRFNQWKRETSNLVAEEAINSVFQKELKGGLKATQELLQETMPGGRMLVPFFTTPVNILEESLKRMPLIPIGEDGTMGMPLHPKVWKNIAAGGNARNEAISQIITGNMLAMVGHRLTSTGIMGLEYQEVPASTDARAYIRQTLGITPGSINVNGQSYTTSWMGPMHNVLALGAAMHSHQDVWNKLGNLDDKEAQVFTDAVTYNMANLTALMMEQPWATGIDKIAELFDLAQFNPDDERNKKEVGDRLSKMLGGMAGNLVPYSSLMRSTQMNVMEEMRRADGFVDHALMSFAPALVEAKAYDNFNRPYGPNKSNIFRFTEHREATFEFLLYDENGWMPERPKHKFTYYPQNQDSSVRLGSQINLVKEGVWDEFNEIAAEKLQAKLREVRNTDEYQNNLRSGNIGYNRKLLDGTVRKVRNEAMDVLVEKYPLLKYKADVEMDKNRDIMNRPTAPLMRPEPQALPEVVR